jgi:hypothetical protein
MGASWRKEKDRNTGVESINRALERGPLKVFHMPFFTAGDERYLIYSIQAISSVQDSTYSRFKEGVTSHRQLETLDPV